MRRSRRWGKSRSSAYPLPSRASERESARQSEVVRWARVVSARKVCATRLHSAPHTMRQSVAMREVHSLPSCVVGGGVPEGVTSV
jgi:hypothetical protein